MVNQSLSTYAEICALSNFSFLRGASHAEEHIRRAHELGLRAIAITDLNSLAGIVRAHCAARNVGLQLIIGALLIIRDKPEANASQALVCVYPHSRAAYGRLCQTLTTGNLRASKGECFLTLEDLAQVIDDSAFAICPGHTFAHCPSPSLEAHIHNVARFLGEHARSFSSVMLNLNYGYASEYFLQRTCALARDSKLSLVASNVARYHIPERKPLADVLTCIREGVTIENAGFLLQQNTEAFLHTPQEMHYIYRHFPEALQRTLEIADWTSSFSLEQLRYEYPEEICPPGATPLEYLTQLTWDGAQQRFPEGIPADVRQTIEQELKLIHELRYEKYFLTCRDIVRFARERGILCQGRGAAANSAVCFCLGITSVDPSRINLLFARFVSRERKEPPDIDIDFEHERREEVIQYIYSRFGRERAGLTAEVITYRQRSAVRETAKALGLSNQIAGSLAKSIHHWTKCALPAEELRALGLDPLDPRVQQTMRFTHELLSFPRHLSQHVGGFIISDSPLSEFVPILKAGMEERTIIEWDKDDIEALGLLKIDILALGMLTCIRKALDEINKQHSKAQQKRLDLHSIPAEDPAVYDMLCEADTVGVFQIESRAQMSMLPRLKPRCFYDLVIEVAIVRPGPIQGNMVHPFLKRRNGLEKPYYPDKRVVDILGKTLGVPLFQEQAMRLAIVLADFSPDEAEALRRAMAAWKRDKGRLASFTARIVQGMLKNGYSHSFAETCCEQMKGFSEYGFPESHAASFALLVYASAWIKRHHPAIFAMALLNSQPMGFYAPAQIIRDARQHGVQVLPIDVLKSGWDCAIEGTALRLGFRLIRGIAESQANIVCQCASNHSISSLNEVWLFAQRYGRLHKATLSLMARADAFHTLGLSSRDALWHIRALPNQIAPLDLYFSPPNSSQTKTNLPGISTQQSMFQDYEMTGLSLRAHPIQFIRSMLLERGATSARELQDFPPSRLKERVAAAGVVLVRQRPHTAHGVVFLTLEDETAMLNLIIKPQIFERFQKIIINHSCLLVRGRLERVGRLVYINAEQLESLDHEIAYRSSAKQYSY
ncbi:MAG: error-prone DNA polymerase [Oligoflexia bacterium]|nr:error-prone DNA polymerase [Oligoflexia bacterium]